MADFDFLDGVDMEGDWGFTGVSSKPSNQTVADTKATQQVVQQTCLLYTSPSPRDGLLSRMPSSA